MLWNFRILKKIDFYKISKRVKILIIKKNFKKLVKNNNPKIKANSIHFNEWEFKENYILKKMEVIIAFIRVKEIIIY